MNFQLVPRCLTSILRFSLPKKEVQQLLSRRSQFWRSSQHVQSVSTFPNARFDLQQAKQHEHQTHFFSRCCMCNVLTVPTLVQTRHLAIANKTSKNEMVLKDFQKFDYAGDLTTLQPLDPNDTLFVFNSVEELNEAPEVVRRLCSIEFADRTQRRYHRIFAMKKKIEGMCGVEYRREMIIANMTLQVRATVYHLVKFPHDKQAKRFVVEKIAKRKRELRRLRHEDYERFLWLLKELEIKYVATPAYTKRETRYARRKRLAREEAFAMKKQKLTELKERLAEEKQRFLEHKAVVLAEIEADLAKFNINKDDLLKHVEKERLKKLHLNVADEPAK